MKYLLILILIFYSISFMGCSQKEPDVKYVYLQDTIEPYPFTTIYKDIKGKLSISFDNDITINNKFITWKEARTICTPYVLESTDKVYKAVEFLENQMIQYNKDIELLNKKIQYENDNRTKE